MNSKPRFRPLCLGVVGVAAIALGAAGALLGVCGPFTDVSDATFCPFVLEIFTLGITTGTTPTTYDPVSSVNRLQMAAFLSRTADGALKRRSRRALFEQWWTPKSSAVLGMSTVGSTPLLSAYDGHDIWVASSGDGRVTRIRASDGNLEGIWQSVGTASAVLSAMGRILVAAADSPGVLYTLDPASPPGGGVPVASNLGNQPLGIAFDGAHVFTANLGSPGSVSLVTPGATIPWTVTTVTAGFTQPQGVLYDGANIWVTDFGAGTLLKLNAAGGVLQTVPVAGAPRFPAFDGTNIWVPGIVANAVTVVRASSGAVLQTLTGNGLNTPVQAAFDGERILVTNYFGNSVSLWKAADLTPITTVSTSPTNGPWGVTSDGLNFFISLSAADKLARF